MQNGARRDPDSSLGEARGGATPHKRAPSPQRGRETRRARGGGGNSEQAGRGSEGGADGGEEEGATEVGRGEGRRAAPCRQSDGGGPAPAASPHRRGRLAWPAVGARGPVHPHDGRIEGLCLGTLVTPGPRRTTADRSSPLEGALPTLLAQRGLQHLAPAGPSPPSFSPQSTPSLSPSARAARRLAARQSTRAARAPAACPLPPAPQGDLHFAGGARTAAAAAVSPPAAQDVGSSHLRPPARVEPSIASALFLWPAGIRKRVLAILCAPGKTPLRARPAVPLVHRWERILQTFSRASGEVRGTRAAPFSVSPPKRVGEGGGEGEAEEAGSGRGARRRGEEKGRGALRCAPRAARAARRAARRRPAGGLCAPRAVLATYCRLRRPDRGSRSPDRLYRGIPRPRTGCARGAARRFASHGGFRDGPPKIASRPGRGGRGGRFRAQGRRPGGGAAEGGVDERAAPAVRRR